MATLDDNFGTCTGNGTAPTWNDLSGRADLWAPAPGYSDVTDGADVYHPQVPLGIAYPPTYSPYATVPNWSSAPKPPLAAAWPETGRGQGVAEGAGPPGYGHFGGHPCYGRRLRRAMGSGDAHPLAPLPWPGRRAPWPTPWPGPVDMDAEPRKLPELLGPSDVKTREPMEPGRESMRPEGFALAAHSRAPPLTVASSVVDAPVGNEKREVCSTPERSPSPPQRSALEKKWVELDEREQAAAVGLGWPTDGEHWPGGEAGQRWNTYASMVDMQEEARQFWLVLGFDEERWQAWGHEQQSKEGSGRARMPRRRAPSGGDAAHGDRGEGLVDDAACGGADDGGGGPARPQRPYNPDVYQRGKRLGRLLRGKHTNYSADAMKLLAEDPDRLFMKPWGGSGAMWPYCSVCDCWVHDNHVSGRRHVIALEPASQTQKKGTDGWHAYCRVCRCWSDMAHVDSQEHHAAVSRWEAEEEECGGPTTVGKSWSMTNFILRKIEAEERKHDGGHPLRNISKRILMPEQVEEYCTWDIVEYLKEYAPPRFLDRHQLTGRIKMVQGRNNRTQLVRCVGLLYEAWREALQHLNLLRHLEDDEVEEDDEEWDAEELDANKFAEHLVLKLESFCVEPLGALLEEEEAAKEEQNEAITLRQWQ